MMTVLPTPAPPKMPILPPLRERADEVDDLDARLEDLDVGGLLVERRRRAMDRQADLGLDRALVVDRVAEHVEDPAQGDLADRHRDRGAGVEHVDAAGQAVGRGHGHGADPVVAEVLLDLARSSGSWPARWISTAL